ncbi:DUF11 domain-containing protein [Saccharothrix syringae]|uniref:DUF11 domain-containing protein n=1 Tax=Saccharothrix syringae TaxID=103733 RepID=A0A5Q0GZ68_SACSY|nr:DUF11 domain-containing protein [Saccharothrix syringae]QFZ18682.1 hypothetical protein EKG83_15490 [Saccharothrix syringae]
MNTLSRRLLGSVGTVAAALALVLGTTTPSWAVAPSNDDFANARVETSSFTDSLSNVDATTESGEPVLSDCTFDPEFPATKTVWYGLTITAGTEVSVSTAGSNFDTIVTAYTGTDLGSLSEIACNDDENYPSTLTSLMEFTASASTTYWIQVGGVPNNGGNAGNLAVDVVLTAPAETDMSVSVTDSPDPVSLGNNVTYTVTVSNAGPATATGATASSSQLQGDALGIVSVTPSQGSCTVSGPNVFCTLGTIAASASATVTIVGTPASTSTLRFVFVAGNSGQPDPDTSNNARQESTTVNNALGCTIVGTNGNDTITGTNSADVICALGGNDTINGRNGNDTIYAGDGNDSSYGEDLLGLLDNGADTIYGGPGNDTLDGQNGNDTLIDHDGTDSLSGGNGNDSIDVQDGVGGDTANGGLGTDTCLADTGDTTTGC